MIFLGLGSNLPSSFGDRFKNINLALSYIEKSGIKIIKKSNFYESLSYPNKNNPKFINIVVSVSSNLSAKDLMSNLILIEEKLERKRNKKNDPRTCDIDIIDYNNQVLNLVYNQNFLKIPHPRMKERNFILFPLREISPLWKDPISGETIDNLIDKLSDDLKKSILKL
jgi:2-amino-4-hydroxy-6-hydroxymethyldihydropteridine diphosphokinase